MTATHDLRPGDVVVVFRPPTGRRVLRGTVYDGETATVKYTEPNPRTGWEYKKPATSASWSVYFTDGTYAGSTLNAQWIRKEV